MKQSDQIQRALCAGYVVFLVLLVTGAVFLFPSQVPVPEEPLGTHPAEHEAGVFVATAYDLSIACCGKALGHPQRGVTAAGVDLNGLSRTEAKVVAADPEVLPLGTRIRLEFLDFRHREYDGVYRVLDTGSQVQGDHLDVFLGDFGEEQAEAVREFGRTRVRVYVLADGDGWHGGPRGPGTH